MFNFQIKKSFLIVAGAVILLFAIIGIIFINSIKPVSVANPEQSEFIIDQGMGVGEISQQLYAGGLIKSKLGFEIYSFLNGKFLKFKPGVYLLDSGQSARRIIDILTGGPKEITAVIAPGMTLREMDDYLSSIKIIKKGELITFNLDKIKSKYQFLASVKSLEGFLFPDTYQFFAASDPADVVDKILDNFREKALPSFSSVFSNNDKFSEKLILASLLEKEVVDYKDKQIVAGILEKRIAAGMPLQIDATVIYAVCGGRFKTGNGGCGISRASGDFKIDSPYNTYKYKGYPPAPISNPGIDSINAALNPIKSNYWFYLSDLNTKKTIFAKTLDEQNNNMVKYLQ